MSFYKICWFIVFHWWGTMTTVVSLLWNHSSDYTLGPELHFIWAERGILDGIIQEC